MWPLRQADLAQGVASYADVLIFVEDPGAANYVAQLPEALNKRGLHTRLLAAGSSADYLRECRIPLEGVPDSATAKEILEQARPRLLIVGTAENPDTLGLALLSEASRARIESVAVIDALANAEYRFRGRGDGPLTHAPDWLLVPDELTKDAYVALSYPSAQATVCGHPHYDHVRTIGAQLAGRDRTALRHSLFPGVSEKRTVVVFAAEVSTGLDPDQYRRSPDYSLAGRGLSDDRTHIVLEEFLDAILPLKPRPYLVLRLHPKNAMDEFSHVVDDFDTVSSGGSPIEVAYAADLMVGMTSMLLLEAALLERPTMSIVPRALEMDWLPAIRMGATPCATTRCQVRKVLGELLCCGSPAVQNDLGHTFVSGSLHRVVEFVERRLARQAEVRSRTVRA